MVKVIGIVVGKYMNISKIGKNHNKSNNCDSNNCNSNNRNSRL